jgi:hypothetical protein
MNKGAPYGKPFDCRKPDIVIYYSLFIVHCSLFIELGQR